MKRRHAILLLGGASAGAMSVGTGAFSSVEADRGVEVSVVDDDEAYLGLEVTNRIATVDRRADVVQITNSFTDQLSLDVSVVTTNQVVDAVAVADNDYGDGDEFSLALGPGDGEPIAIKCGEPGEASFTLEFDGAVDGTSVELTRTFDEIDCLVSAVNFNGGSGSVRLEGEFTDLTVVKEFESGQSAEPTVSSKSGKYVLHPRNGGGGGTDAIERVRIGSVVYERPPTSGSGSGGESGSGSN